MAIDEPGVEGELPGDAGRWLRPAQGAAAEMTRAGETEEGVRKTRGWGPGEPREPRHREAASEAGGEEVAGSEARHGLTLGLVEGLKRGELVLEIGLGEAGRHGGRTGSVEASRGQGRRGRGREWRPPWRGD